MERISLLTMSVSLYGTAPWFTQCKLYSIGLYHGCIGSARLHVGFAGLCVGSARRFGTNMLVLARVGDLEKCVGGLEKCVGGLEPHVWCLDQRKAPT